MPPKASRSRKRKGSSQQAIGTSKRATRSSSRNAASNTTQDKSLPLEAPGSDVLERTPDQVQSGAVSVDVGALTATITAAISQGLRDSGIVPQLPAPTTQSVDQAANDAVVQATDELTMMPVGMSGQTTPSSVFSSASVSLVARVPVKLRAKIWADEYFDLGTLLSHSPADMKFSVSISHDSSQPRLCLEPANKVPRITTIHQWVSAFNSFVAVYTQRKPAATADLLKYTEVVRDIATKGGNWRYYDEQFRFLRQSSPSSFPWGQVHWELWFYSLHNFRGHAGQQTSQPKSTRKSQQFFPKGTCWAFQAGRTCNGCQYEHVCYKCGQGHPASQCRSTTITNPKPRSFSSTKSANVRPASFPHKSNPSDPSKTGEP